MFVLLVAFLFTSNAAFAHFGSKGPFGGSVSCGMVYDTTVYIGTFEGGVYQSTNSRLVAWRALPVGLNSGKITALAHSGKYLLVGTAENGVYIYTGFVGSDRYWVKINNGLGNLNIRSLIALDSTTILAGTAGGGLFKTTNKGASWTAINNTSMDNSVVTALVKAGNRLILSTLNGGVFASSDKGATWTSFNDANTLNVEGTISLSYNAATDELLVINKNGLFTATKASTIASPVYTAAWAGLAAGAVVRGVSNNDANWYLATDKGVFVSATGTLNWTSANAGLTTLDVTTVVPFKTNLVAGTKVEGLFKTTAASIAWKENNVNFNNLAVYAMETSGITVVVAATEKGVYVSRDLASSYKRANKGLTDSLNVTYLKFFGKNLYASTKNGGVFMSADTGKTWVAINSGLNQWHIKKVLASNTDLYALDADGQVWQYVGTTWTSIQNGLPTGAIPTSMAFYGTKILLGTWGQGVFVRETSGGTWSAANTGLTNLMVSSVAASNSRIFAGTDGSGVFVSEMGAPNWKQSSNTAISHTALMGLDGSKIQEMAYYAGYVFASYKGGLLASSDHGATWIAGGNQFNLPSYTNVRNVTFVTTRVFVSTEYNSLYSNALSELPVVTGVDDLAPYLNANIRISPNPTSSNFNVALQSDDLKMLEVLIYDQTGRLMQRLLPSNGQQVTVDATYPKGIYLVQIRTDKGTATQKVVVE